MILPKDVLTLPVSPQIQALAQSRLVQTLPMVFQAMERDGMDRFEGHATENFAMVVTAIMVQAEALNRLVDLLVEPESEPMALVSVAVREEVRRRVRDVFKAGGQA